MGGQFVNLEKDNKYLKNEINYAKKERKKC